MDSKWWYRLPGRIPAASAISSLGSSRGSGGIFGLDPSSEAEVAALVDALQQQHEHLFYDLASVDDDMPTQNTMPDG